MRSSIPITMLDDLLLNEQFDGTAVNTALWALTDTESKLSVSDGNLVCAGGMAAAAWDDPMITGPAEIVRAGVTFEAEINLSNLGAAGNGVQVGFDASAPAASLLSPGIWVKAGVLSAATAAATSVVLPVTLATGTSYLLRIVLTNAGAIWYYSTDAGATWAAIWEVASGFTGTVYPAYNNKDAVWTSSYCKVYQGSIKSAIVSDTFTRANSPTSLGTADSGQLWTALAGAWGINGNQAYRTIDANDNYAVVESGIADGIIDVTYAVAGATQRLVFRCSDADNLWLVTNQVGNWLLYKRDGGAYTQQGDAYAAAAVDGDVVRVVLVGSNIAVYINDTQRITATSSFNATATQHGIGADAEGGTAARWDNFKVQGG